MKNLIPLCILVLLLQSCSHDQHRTGTASGATDTVPILHPAGMSYSFGPVLNDTICKIEAACDCCTSDILFTDEKHFIAIFWCLQDDTYAHGSYRVEGSKVYLHYEGKKVDYITSIHQAYDSLTHLDTVSSASQYVVDTIPHSIDTLSAFICHRVVAFKSKQLDYGLPAKINVDLQQLRKDSILQMMGL